MIRFISITGLLTFASCAAALAACPTSVPGNSKEAIQANERRILCLQEEIDQETRLRHLELQLRANENAIQALQLQRRFDNLPKLPAPSAFTQPSPFVPN
ncbi:MAG: hypothetical protein EOP50_14400 [Sphingobacteriales bacterium]|nr:MAG: hypothetical protein EOP50_14400 [Sphingobacteriales bacterium]